MSPPRGRTPTWLILGVIVVGAAAAAVWGYALFRLPRRERPALEESIRRIDEELSRGAVQRAEELLRAGYTSARGEGGYLRLLKRELAVGRLTGDFRQLLRFSRGAAQALPGSPRLAAVAAYAALRSEHPESAATILGGTSRHGQLDGLRVEAYLTGWIPSAPLDRLGGRLRSLAELPGLTDPNTLHTLAGLLDDPRLDLDAALLWMRDGLAEQGFSALWAHRGRPEFAEGLLYMALDAGRYPEAWELQGSVPELGQRPDQLILRGDLAWILGNYGAAADHYQRAIEADPAYSWVAYLNLARLVAADGNAEGARYFRSRAFAGFPEQPEVVLAHVQDLVEEGRSARAREVLGTLLRREPANVAAQLADLELSGARSSPAVFQGRMWQLLNRDPGNPELARSLCTYLLRLRDLPGAAAVLRGYERAHDGPYPAWYLELRGALALAQGDPDGAVEFLRDSLTRETDWRRRYNLALALAAGGRDKEALAELIQAESELSVVGGAEAQGMKSRIRSRIAESQVRVGDTAAARREALYALDLDPGNHHARRVLRILEGIQ